MRRYSIVLLLLGCSSGTPPATAAHAPGAPATNGPGNGPASTPGGHPGQPGGPMGPAPGQPGGPPVGAGGSGAAMQDPTGFPAFHDIPAPPGPAPGGLGAFTRAIALAARPAGGYRPQIAVGPRSSSDGAGDVLHAVYYDRVPEGDIVRYRQSKDGVTWSAPETVSMAEGRNWGPDIVVRADGSVVIVYDHAEKDFSSRGWLRIRSPDGTWTDPAPLTPDGPREMGSGHVANAGGDDLAYVYITKPLGEQDRFVATSTWRVGGTWTPARAFSDGTLDAWHSNVERRPDGSVLAGYDVGNGASETTLYTVDGRDGAFGKPENMSATSHPGERPNFAFAPGLDWVTWFHKVGGVPLHVYVRSGHPGAWGEAVELSKGLGGYHFDPDLQVNKDGVLCAVWGWDAGGDAELLYSLDRGSGWDPPRKVADIDWGKPGLPSIDADSTGAFHVVWNQGVRGTNEVYYAKLVP